MLEERCDCNCTGCVSGRHCGLLDNDCGYPRSGSLPEDLLRDDDEELLDDEMRASMGMFDKGALDDNSLFPGLNDDDEPGE